MTAPRQVSKLATILRPGRTFLRSRSGGAIAAILLALIGPALAITTVRLLQLREGGEGDPLWLTILLVTDVAYGSLLVALIAGRVMRLRTARREHFAGAALHLRFIGAFTLIAVSPALAVAVFATITINFGFEAWFNERVGRVLHHSLQVADTYIEENSAAAQADAVAVAQEIDRFARPLREPQLADLLFRASRARGLKRAYVIDGEGRISLRGYNSYLFNFAPPPAEMLAQAASGTPVSIIDETRGEVRALVALARLPGSFVYVAHDVDANALRHAAGTGENVALYRSLERQSNQVLFNFGLIYVIFATFITLSAVWLGFMFAGRMSRPIGRLAEAAQRIGGGDLDARVTVPPERDEMAALSHIFNQMAEQVQDQRNEILTARQNEAIRRRFIEGVLSGVPAGVIGTSADGKIEVANRAALQMLGAREAEITGAMIGTVFVNLLPVLEAARAQPEVVTERSITYAAEENARELIVRVAPEHVGGQIHGFVITFEDLTELVAAQRAAAWGEIARRVAHEIKNPLTPIQLAAERLRERVPADSEETRELLERYTDLIQRQVSEISQLVEEFSRFARMPPPRPQPEDLVAVLTETVHLERNANPDIAYSFEAPHALPAHCDRAMISQAVTNLLKNAIHATRARMQEAAGGDQTPAGGQIRVSLQANAEFATIEVEDNGDGFPRRNRNALLDPYRANRPGGAGLGLAIVRRAMDAHGGSIQLLDARDGQGARVVLQFPLSAEAQR